MSGPAEAVFDGVVVPGLLGEPTAVSHPPAAQSVGPPSPLSSGLVQGGADTSASSAVASALPAIDCATACTKGCLRPEACSSAEARARVATMLEGRSLDELVALATATPERRLLEGPRPDGSP
jgi:diaminopimelate epimerase